MALQSCLCLVFVALMLTVQLHCVMGSLDIQALRLNGSQSSNEGRVEVLMNGSWYTVCEEHWGNHDSNAACRQLRYPGGSEMTDDEAEERNITEGSLRFLLKEFKCQNNDEIKLSECETKDINSCDEAAKVICEGNKSTTVLPSSSPEYNTTVMLNMTPSLKDTNLMTEAPTQEGPNEITESGSSSRKQSQQFPTAVVAPVCTVLGLLLLLAVLVFFICRRRARSQEDNMTSKHNDTDHVGMEELGTAQHDDSEKTYHTIQDPAVNNKGLPVIPTAPPSEHDENYSTIPDVQSSPTGGRVDERAPATPPGQTDVYYSVVRDSDTASPADQTGTSGTAKTTQEPEYAVVKKASKRKENKKEESDQGTGAPGPEYAVVNKNHKKEPKTEGKGNNRSGTVDNVIYEPY